LISRQQIEAAVSINVIRTGNAEINRRIAQGILLLRDRKIWIG
jgi:hypothetical protein